MAERAAVLGRPGARRGDRPIWSGVMLWVYLVNASLVLCHEVDSAIWREWELFHLPGGAVGFVAVHLVVVPLILVGLVQLGDGGPGRRWICLLVGLGGLVGASAHGTFLVLGDARFATGFSIALIAAFGLTSAALLAMTLWCWRRMAVAPRPQANRS